MSEIKYNWEKFELNEILSISSKKFNPLVSTENKKCIELEHLSQETGELLGYINSNEQKSIKNSFEKGQVLFGKLRPYLKKFWKADFDGVCSSEIWVMSGKKVKNDFLFYLVQTEKFNQVANISSGSKMPRSDWNFMSEIPFDIPPLKEQEKIASILTTWDSAIAIQSDLIKEKQKHKKALMQKLLSGEVRFSGFNDEWEEVNINDFLQEYNIKNTMLYPQYAIGKKGITLITEQNYKINEHKVFKMNDFIMGIGVEEINININFKNGCCSPIYNIFSVDKNILNPHFGHYYMKKILFKLKNRFCKKSTRREFEIDNKEFKKLKIPLPSLAEQTKIAEVLSLADNEINFLENELKELKLQKKSLMQKLLTGQVKVKV